MEVTIVDNTVVLTTASGEQTIIQSANIVLDGAIKGARYNSAPQAISSNPIDGTQLTQAVRYKIILPLVNKDEEYFYLDEVTNQATWTNDLTGANQAVEDIAASFPTSGGGGGGVTSVGATTPLSSTGGTTPNIAIASGTTGQVLQYNATTGNWERCAGLNGLTSYVDGTYGDDATAQPYNPFRPYKTLTAAQTAATSGDLIHVRAGSYTITLLGKNGVNWYFDAGATVTGNIGDGGVAMTFSIYGQGVFTYASGNAVAQSNASSNITIYAKSITATSNVGSPIALDCRGGSQTVYANVSSTGTGGQGARCVGATSVQTIFGDVFGTLLGCLCGSSGTQYVHGNVTSSTTGANVNAGTSQIIYGNVTASEALAMETSGTMEINGRVTGSIITVQASNSVVINGDHIGNISSTSTAGTITINGNQIGTVASLVSTCTITIAQGTCGAVSGNHFLLILNGAEVTSIIGDDAAHPIRVKAINSVCSTVVAADGKVAMQSGSNGNTGFFAEAISFPIGSVVDGTINLLKFGQPTTIFRVVTECDAGSSVLSVSLGGTPITGLTGIAVSTGETSATATAANHAAAGAYLSFDFSGSSGCEGAVITIYYQEIVP